MMPIPEYQQVNRSLFVWNGYDPECKVDCTSTAVRTPEGFVFIDPIRLEEKALEELVGTDKVAAILLTSGNHERASVYERRRLDIPVYAPAEVEDLTADHHYSDGDVLFGLKAIAVQGGGPGEHAFLGGNVLILGDALTNLGALQILPDKYAEDSSLLRDSLRKLESVDFDILCFAHGLPIVTRAREALHSVLTREASVVS